jgi:hypothetical protein
MALRPRELQFDTIDVRIVALLHPSRPPVLSTLLLACLLHAAVSFQPTSIVDLP